MAFFLISEIDFWFLTLALMKMANLASGNLDLIERMAANRVLSPPPPAELWKKMSDLRILFHALFTNSGGRMRMKISSFGRHPSFYISPRVYSFASVFSLIQIFALVSVTKLVQK